MTLEKILVVDDELIICKSIEEALRAKRYSVTSASTLATAERLLGREHYDLLLLDVRLPDGDGTDLLERIANRPNPPVTIMMSGYGTVESAVGSMRGGAFDYLIKPFSMNQIEVMVKKVESYRQVLKLNEYLTAEISDGRLVGESPAMRELKETLRKVAPTEATALITGESGTGKERVANAIFHASSRAQAPYVKVRCTEISESLIESELFGHEKGAFPGATERREGRFDLAHGGTLLLDEISALSLSTQAKLLRVLQEQEYERVGGTKTIKVDVRLLATTSRDLKKAIANGDFREDLYYRLNVFPVEVIPLRERREDIPLLIEHFRHELASKHGVKIRGFSAEAMAFWTDHPWPGNVRELQNTVELAVLQTGSGAAVTEPAPSPGEPSIYAPASPGESPENFPSLADLESEHIQRALRQTGGNRTHAAKLLGISIRTLRNKLNAPPDSSNAE